MSKVTTPFSSNQSLHISLPHQFVHLFVQISLAREREVSFIKKKRKKKKRKTRLRERSVLSLSGGVMILGFRFRALDPWNFWYSPMITGCATFGTEDPCERKRGHAVPVIAEAYQDFYTRRGGGAGAILFPRESAVKVALSNGHAWSCAPKLKAAGKRWKTETDVSSARDPMWLQFLVVFMQRHCRYHLPWSPEKGGKIKLFFHLQLIEHFMNMALQFLQNDEHAFFSYNLGQTKVSL